METWAGFWKVFVILGVGFFAAVSVWVTIAGLSDIRHMLRELRQPEGEKSPD